MTNNYKFRGKDKEGVWRYGSLIEEPHRTRIFTPKSDKSSSLVEVDPKTVGQWTGEVDEDGIGIYVGDNVKTPDDWDEYGMQAGEVNEVYFSFGGFRLKPNYNEKAKGYWLEDGKKLKVISNKHDNEPN